MSDILKVQNLNLSFGNTVVFKDICFNLKEKSVFSLVGPSGCGKSSLLMCINLLIENFSQAKLNGEIEFEGKSLLTSKNISDLRKQISYISQKPSPFPLSIRKNLEIPIKEHITKNKNDVDDLIHKTLDDVGLLNEVKGRLNESAIKLSGGQQQRLCIARSLALNPKIILMDEPCSALDPVSTNLIEDLILKLKQQHSILLVTHNLAQAKRVSDFTGFIWYENGYGKLIETNETQLFFEKPQLESTRCYINGVCG